MRDPIMVRYREQYSEFLRALISSSLTYASFDQN